MAAKPHYTDSVANTVTANRKVFAFFCFVGVVLISAGLLSLRLDKRIPATGYVMADQEYYVFAPAQGGIASHHVRIGDEVEEGELLFSLESGDLDLRILEKTRQLAEARSRAAELAFALRRLEIRPGEPLLLTAEERLRLVEKIREIQRDIVAAWERLEGERAVRGLEYNLQRVEALRTELEEVDLRLWAQWEESGLATLEREELEANAASIQELIAVQEQELALLQKKRADLDVTAPIAGTVVDIYYRYPGMVLEEGERVLKIVRMDGAYRVRAYVGQRNIDLLGAGDIARMESRVFDSLFEGYVYGRVERIVREASQRFDPGNEPLYEVTVRVEETPYPLVLGSNMEIDFLLGRQSLLAILMNRPEESRPPAGSPE